MKTCSKCGADKPSDQFYKRDRQCKACFRKVTEAYRQKHKAYLHGRVVRQRRAARLGLTLTEYDALPCDPGQACSVCGVPPERPRNGRFKNGSTAATTKRLAIDHCHVTDRIRGFLCTQCNQAIGLAADDPELLRKMALYLERTEPAWEPLTLPKRNVRALGNKCSVEGCAKVPSVRDLCPTHYARERRTGDPHLDGRRRKQPTCSIDGCDRQHYGHGWCRPHWRRWRNHGDPTAGRPVAAIA